MFLDIRIFYIYIYIYKVWGQRTECVSKDAVDGSSVSVGERKPESYCQDCFPSGGGTSLTWLHKASPVHKWLTESILFVCPHHFSDGSAELQGHHGDGRASEENSRAVWHERWPSGTFFFLQNVFIFFHTIISSLSCCTVDLSHSVLLLFSLPRTQIFIACIYTFAL